MSAPTHRVVVIECLCRRQSYRYAVVTPTEPLAVFACHCNSCRHAGGALFHGAMFWKYPLLESRSGPPPVTYESYPSGSQLEQRPVEHKTSLVKYTFGKRLTFWFCGSCGTKMWWRYNPPSQTATLPLDEEDRPLEIFPGLIPTDSWLIKENHLSYTTQVFVGDTVDGGASAWIAGARCWSGYTNMSEELKTPLAKDAVVLGTISEVSAYCHCQNIRYTWCPTERNCRPKVILDTSEDIRRAMSVEISAWAFSTLEEITSNVQKGQHPFAPGEKILEVPVRVENTQRRLLRCRGCSASIGYLIGDYGIMLAIGLFDDNLGARVKSFLDWSAVVETRLAGRGVVIPQQG